MRLVLNALILMCGPIVLISQAYMLRNLLDVVPWWLWVIALAAHAVVILGFASLVDDRQGQSQKP